MAGPCTLGTLSAAAALWVLGTLSSLRVTNGAQSLFLTTSAQSFSVATGAQLLNVTGVQSHSVATPAASFQPTTSAGNASQITNVPHVSEVVPVGVSTMEALHNVSIMPNVRNVSTIVTLNNAVTIASTYKDVTRGNHLTLPSFLATDTHSIEKERQSQSPPSDPDTRSKLRMTGKVHLEPSHKVYKDHASTSIEGFRKSYFLPRALPSETLRSAGRKTRRKPLHAEVEPKMLITTDDETSNRKYPEKKVPMPRDYEPSLGSALVTRPSSHVYLSLPDVTKSVVRRETVGNVATDSPLHHRTRHSHSGLPAWLRERLDETPSGRRKIFKANQIEEEIAEVFRDVAYRSSSSKAYPPARRQDVMPFFITPGSNRIERTTVLSKSPHYDYVADGGNGDLLSGRRNMSVAVLSPNTSVPIRNESKRPHLGPGRDGRPRSNSAGRSDQKENPSVLERMLELQEYDHELYDLYEGHYTDIPEIEGKSEITRRGNSVGSGTAGQELPADQGDEKSNESKNETQTTQEKARQSGTEYKHTPRLSWFDALLCSNRNLAWILVNFTLGLILLGLSLLAAYRLMALKSCTHLLPRTHFVIIHLLVFIAAFLKALYLFHLAYGSKEKLPLVLVLLLTNTGFPCFTSSFLIIMIMMFLTADVQVYKPKLFTMHNISIFVIMKFALCFVADIIVGSAHSKSVLVLSRVMLIAVTVGMIVFYARKYQMVLQVSQMLKREFQGELKLLVVPSKDLSHERQMGIKQILTNRLNLWCQVMKLIATALGVLCLIHLSHTVFLICSHVPAWGWWTFHILGCLVESLLSISICVAAALTQRYDDKISFLHNFLVPSNLLEGQKEDIGKERNGNAVFQRVSFSSGTESTQYTSCFPEAGSIGCEPASRTPKATRRCGVTVKRSATFSHGPQHQQASRDTYGPPIALSQVIRAGSASQIPLYSPGSHISIYGPNLVSRVPVYNPHSIASMLVHEDGFVRIKTQLDPHQANPHSYNSQNRLQDSNMQGSNPQIHGSSVQQLNGLGRQENFYQSLSRRRNSHTSDILHNNIDTPESDYHSSPSSRRSYLYSPNLPPPVTEGRTEPDYRSLSRTRSLRDPTVQHLNNIDRQGNYYYSLQRKRGKSGGRDHQLHHMNNLDRPDNTYNSLTRRQVSQEDNNYPREEGDYHCVPAARRSLREPKLPPLNLHEDQGTNYRLPPQCGSPSTRHKISNFPASPTVSTIHNTYLSGSPGSSRREAHFPKPFVRLGSNVSLQSEDCYYTDYLPRGHPVRRNHSSAGYFPSRNMAPPSPSLTDALRYGSLRVGASKKRQPGYVLNTNTNKLFEQCRDRYPRNADKEGYSRDFKNSSHENTNVNGPSGRRPLETLGSKQEAYEREGPSRYSENRGEESDSTDQDWALELIKSSTILTDFYSLENPEEAEEDKMSEAEKVSDNPENR
ncbi:LOW QUALITY PROTEIN: uncharacterized protein [Procambarus clarkii]|uniref:LOW QUALITY PROTEIN: uncharacterized protein n=1 Tax=Procambarus clarkii TaxID=6728 RepID=UPI0037431767